MLTGSACMREPWGVSAMYGITDPNYRGLLFIPKDRLREMVRAAAQEGLQFTAHSVGDGAVQALLDGLGGYQSAQSLHLRSSDGMWTGLNDIESALTANSLGSGSTATLKLTGRWLR